MTVQAPPTIQERIGRLHATLGRSIIADPSILEEIPNGSALFLIPEDSDEEFVEANIALGLDALRKGRSVYFKRLAPGEWDLSSLSNDSESTADSEAPAPTTIGVPPQ
jgi:hypothetical protein